MKGKIGGVDKLIRLRMGAALYHEEIFNFHKNDMIGIIPVQLNGNLFVYGQKDCYIAEYGGTSSYANKNFDYPQYYMFKSSPNKFVRGITHNGAGLKIHMMIENDTDADPYYMM